MEYPIDDVQWSPELDLISWMSMNESGRRILDTTTPVYVTLQAYIDQLELIKEKEERCYYCVQMQLQKPLFIISWKRSKSS